MLVEPTLIFNPESVFIHSFLLTLTLINRCQIVHWRNHLRFPEDAQLTLEAKDLIYRLLCDVDHRLGTRGAQEIKVRHSFF